MKIHSYLIIILINTISSSQKLITEFGAVRFESNSSNSSYFTIEKSPTLFQVLEFFHEHFLNDKQYEEPIFSIVKSPTNQIFETFLSHEELVSTRTFDYFDINQLKVIQF